VLPCGAYLNSKGLEFKRAFGELRKTLGIGAFGHG
jgi:hypothetical protein